MANENGKKWMSESNMKLVRAVGYDNRFLYKYLNCAGCEKQIVPDGGTVVKDNIELIQFAEKQHASASPECENPMLVINFDSVLVSRKIK